MAKAYLFDKADEAPPAPAPERWLIICGGDGYGTHVAEGREAMERIFLEQFLGPPGEPFSKENVEYGEALLEHLRDTDENWLMNYQLGPVEYTYHAEDGHVHVYRLTHSAGPKP